eukprot:4087326-Alexandrium_andersonii.AAC.1
MKPQRAGVLPQTSPKLCRATPEVALPKLPCQRRGAHGRVAIGGRDNPPADWVSYSARARAVLPEEVAGRQR